MEDDKMALENGSKEYYKITEHAERIYRKKCECRSSDERRKWTERGQNLADQLTEEYGYGDPMVKRIIEDYSLDRD